MVYKAQLCVFIRMSFEGMWSNKDYVTINGHTIRDDAVMELVGKTKLLLCKACGATKTMLPLMDTPYVMMLSWN